MHIKLAVVALTGVVSAGLTALPASAQAYGYGDPCRAEQRANTGAGAVIGGILGGVLGSNIAGRGHRGDGTAVGVGLGALVGGAAGNSTRDCTVGYGPPRPAAIQPGGPYDRTGEPGRYGPGGYDRYGDDDRYSTEDPRYSGDYGYHLRDDRGGRADIGRHDRYGSDAMSRPDHDGRLDGGRDDDYNASNDGELRDCREVDQTTRLPDGTKVTRPVEACRSARFGEWTVRD